MSLNKIDPVIYGDMRRLIAYLRSKGLLARNMVYQRWVLYTVEHSVFSTPMNPCMYRCNTQMVDHPREDVSDGFSWWCSHCKTRKTIREGSFFKKSHMTLRQWLLLLHLWAKMSPVTSAAEDLEISRPAAIDAYQWLREVCSTTLLQTPIMLGGAGCIVQIDESLFRHKPKVDEKFSAAFVSVCP